MKKYFFIYLALLFLSTCSLKTVEDCKEAKKVCTKMCDKHSEYMLNYEGCLDNCKNLFLDCLNENNDY